MITVMLGISVTMNDALYKTTQQSNTNAALAATAEVIYKDLNLAGYNLNGYFSFPFGTTALSDLQFYGDLNNGGIPETIRYYTSYDGTTGLYSLYRCVDRENGGTPLSLGKNFKSVRFQYYTDKGVLTTDYRKAASVRIRLEQQIPGATSGYTTALNDFKVYPANL